MTDYSERIPAAIAKGRELTRNLRGLHLIGERMVDGVVQPGTVLTAGEVALAEALHKTYRALNAESGEEHWPDPLIAFCEKMEGLNHD